MLKDFIKISVLLCLILLLGSCTGDQRAAGTPQKIIFVTIDTLRADHLKPYGYIRETSPFLSSLAEKGVVFRNAFSASSHTAPSHASMFTSLFPFDHGLHRNHEVIDTKFLHLRSLVEQAGYFTQSFVAVRFLDGKVGFDAEPVPTGKKQNFPKKFWYRNAQKVMDHAMAWVETQPKDKPFFLWLHFYDVHEWQSKGNLPKNYMEQMRSTDQAELLSFLKNQQKTPADFFPSEKEMLRSINSYDGRIKFVDDQLKRLSDYLGSQTKEEILWVVTADHGEGLGNHHYAGHGEHLYNEQLHVPLIISSTSGRFSVKQSESLVRTVDLMPTIAELVGKPVPTEAKIRGISLVPILQGTRSESGVEFSFAQRRPKDMDTFRKTWEEGNLVAIQDQDHKLIDHSHADDEFYDRKSDPFETKNLIKSDQTIQKKLRSTLDQLLSGAAEPKAQQNLAPDEVEELKSLGYM